MTTSSAQLKKIKLRFAVFYAVSLVLAFIVMAAFWKIVATNSSSNDDAEALKLSLQQKDETIATLQKQVQSGTPTAGNNDNAGLQKTINEKDQMIASLQTQLQQKDSALQNAGSQNRPSGGDWQQKYQALKSSFDKVSASKKSLKNAYQTLADDNRRLLSQLQSARKG